MLLNTLTILIVFCIISLNICYTVGTTSEQDEIQPLTEDEKKIFSECENSDYRTYIKCLKRHKRQHTTPVSRACIDECLRQNNHDNNREDYCLNKCRKKIRLEEHYSRTVEEEFEKEKRPIVNISTTVNVNNSVLQNLTKLIEELRPKIEIKNIIQNEQNKNSPDVPNIFSLSFSMAGYGSFPIMMPPFMQYPNINCSLCGTIIFKYRCDIICLNETQTRTSTDNARALGNSDTRSRCRSPNCVGGVS